MTRNHADRHARLQARLAELDVLDASGEDERATVVLDQQSVGRLARMDLMQRQQMAMETHRRRERERARIRAALRRLDEGEYGCCAECGDEISAGRLEADPTAPLCVGCAK